MIPIVSLYYKVANQNNVTVFITISNTTTTTTTTTTTITTTTTTVTTKNIKKYYILHKGIPWNNNFNNFKLK